MPKKVIAVDIDDVLSSQVDVLIEFSRERYGDSLSHEDFKKPGDYWSYFENLWSVDEIEGSRRFQEFKDEKYPLQQTVLDGTKKALDVLKENYELHIITSRGADYHEGTIEWVEEHVPGIFKSVHFVDLWSGSDQKITKGRICKDIGAGYLIDDNVEHCNFAAEVGVHALLFGEFGWNAGKDLHPLVTRVADWDGVLRYFDVQAD